MRRFARSLKAPETNAARDGEHAPPCSGQDGEHAPSVAGRDGADAPPDVGRDGASAPSLAGTGTADAALARRARAGDRSAFRDLFHGFAPMVHALLVTRVRPAEADDLVQEVFLAAWQRIGDLREPAQIGAWLAAIALNRARRAHARAPSPTEPLPEHLARDGRDGVAREASELGRAALDALSELSDVYRDVLAMRLVEGLTGPEIARATGASPETVRVQLARGMQLLREKLARKGWR